MTMSDDLFAELLESVEEAGKIAHGDAEASRNFIVEPDSPDVPPKPDSPDTV
jgi:hypothetical protein